jgi:hypothetical protein
VINGFNALIPEGQPKLRAPDMKFNRQIGDYAGQRYSVYGDQLSEAEYQKHLEEVLPGPADQKILEPIFKVGNWMSAGTA